MACTELAGIMADSENRSAPTGRPGRRHAFWNWLTETQVWKSVFRHDRPDTDRNRVLVMLSNVFLHLHPVRIRKSGVKLRYTWCMGGLSFFLFLVLTFTGLLLMFYYRPTLEYAYTDIVGLREHVPLGIMREMHRWGAHAMVITVWLHMFRVFMTGSYKPPREFNWSVGVIMLVLTLLLSFTGYLLPWDQLAIWAITVGSNMARATPFLGHEGPGASLLQARRRPAHSRGRRRAVRAARRHVRRRRRAAALLRAALRRPAARHCRADGRPLLARPQGRRHQRSAVEPVSAGRPPEGVRSVEIVWASSKASSTRVADPKLFFVLAVAALLLVIWKREKVAVQRRSATARWALLLVFFVFGTFDPNFRLDRHQAGQRADRRPDLPARVLRLVLDSRRRC